MDVDNQVHHDDPQFVKVLETCLKMEITAAKETIEANSAKIKGTKTIMRTELDRRKQLKEKTAQMESIRVILNESLTSLLISISETSDTLELMRANADDEYKLIQLRSQEYQNIVAEYKETWHAYRAMYEEFPLAKARNVAKINLQKLQITHMIMTYKKEEMMTIIKQRRRIDWIRTRCKIIEFASIMVERLKMEEKLIKLKVSVEYHGRELRSIETEMQVQRKREEDQKRLRKQKMLEMAPPKINIPYRQMYAQTRHTRVHHQWKQIHEPFDDTISVNTVVLEELCINENTIISPEEIDVESVRGNNPKCITDQTEISNLKNYPVAPEKIDTRAPSVTLNIEESVDKVALVDNDIEMVEIHQKDMQKSQESAKTDASFYAKGNLLKHNATKNIQDEIESKRIRLQRENSKKNNDNITIPVSSDENVDLKFPSSIPKIRKIETVQYDVASIMPMPKPVHHSSIIASNTFSPKHYVFSKEFCESNMSSIDHDFMSRGPSSLYEGSLCNYRLSPNANISPMCVEEEAQMAAPMKYTLQQDNKNQSDDKQTSPFQFSNLMKKAKDNDFILF